jgi:alkaline phosphatase D
MLETRLLARTQPLDYATDLPIKTQRWNMANPAAPVALRDVEADTPAMQRLPAIYEAVGEELRPVLDWRRAQGLISAAPNLPAGFFLAPDVDALNTALDTPERVMLGEAQESWLRSELAESKRANVAWQVIGNQVIMAPVAAPDLSATPPQLAAALEPLRPGVTQLLKLTRFPFPLSTDFWDGYPQARARVLEAMRAAGGNALVVTGDSHTAWANELNDAQGRVAVELGATSVTSPGETEYFEPFGVDFSAGIRARNPHVKHADGAHRGFLLLTLTPARATAEYFSVSNILSKEYEVERTAAFTIAADAGPGVGALTPVT